MKIKETKLGLISIIAVSGAMTKDYLMPLEECFYSHIKAGDLRILIDLREVPLIDSAGLELLSDSLIKFRKAGGCLKLVNAGPLLMDIFLATKMTNIFEIFSDQEKAFRSFL